MPPPEARSRPAGTDPRAAKANDRNELDSTHRSSDQGVFREAPEFKEAMEGDRLWFARHDGRRYRLREPSTAELDRMLLHPAPADALPGIVVFNRGDGLISLTVWLDWWPLNSEEMVADLWRRAAACSPALKPLLENVACLEQGR
jgi:hypothetical protein